MKSYVMTTGLVFALLALAHVWRVIAEGPGVANPFFIATTVAAAALSVWAFVVLRRPVSGLSS